MKIAQFQDNIRQFGGGERVMKALKKTIGAKIYTFNSVLDDKEIEEISNKIAKRMSKTYTVIEKIHVFPT